MAESGEMTVGKVSMLHDPQAFSAAMPEKRSGVRRVLGLDLGTNCGVAFVDIVPDAPLRDVPIVMGQWDLSVGTYDTGPLRHIRLKQFLAVAGPDLIVFEDVKYTGTNEQFNNRTYSAIVARVASAAELLGGFKITLTTWAEERGVPAHGVGIGEIKKHATGKGNANKIAMITAANARFGTTFDAESYQTTGVDNICDAAFCCDMGVQFYAAALK